MKTTVRDDRVLYFDLLRVLASVAVIALYLSARELPYVALGSADWTAASVVRACSGWAIPVFVMIGGALLLDPGRTLRPRSLVTDHLLRIATMFIFWSGAYALVNRLQGTRLRTVVFGFIGGNVHLWFLYMMAGLFLALPLLRKITSSKRLTAYFLVLWGVFSVGTVTLKYVLSYFRDLYGRGLDAVNVMIGLQIAAGYAGYFVLGHFLHTCEIPKKLRGALYAAGIAGIAATALLTRLFSDKYGYSNTIFYDYFTLGIALPAAAAFVFFKYHTPAFRGAVRSVVVGVSRCSLGIYMTHLLAAQGLNALFHFSERIESAALFLPVMTLLVFCVSLLATFLLKKIPFVNKYIV